MPGLLPHDLEQEGWSQALSLPTGIGLRVVREFVKICDYVRLVRAMCDDCVKYKQKQRDKNKKQQNRCQWILSNKELCKLPAMDNKRFCHKHNKYEDYTNEELGLRIYCSDCKQIKVYDGFDTCEKCRIYRKNYRKIKAEEREALCKEIEEKFISKGVSKAAVAVQELLEIDCEGRADPSIGALGGVLG